eukprot:70318-Chlamydomonas_euryale.AAC.1
MSDEKWADRLAPHTMYERLAACRSSLDPAPNQWPPTMQFNFLGAGLSQAGFNEPAKAALIPPHTCTRHTNIYPPHKRSHPLCLHGMPSGQNSAARPPPHP